jgi:hypothetical protein
MLAMGLGLVRVQRVLTTLGLAAAYVVGCSSVPTVRFENPVDAPEAGGAGGSYTCPDRAPPADFGICCGNFLCVGCSDNGDCNGCASTCETSGDTICCRRTSSPGNSGKVTISYACVEDQNECL